MLSRLLLLFIVMTGWNRIGGQIVLNSGKARSRHIRKKEDYSFDSKLKRATEECSYIARNDDESHREELITRIKNEINNRKVVEFYQEREEEKKRSKEFYDSVEKEEREKVLRGNAPPRAHPPWDDGFRRPPPPRRRHPPGRPMFTLPPESFPFGDAGDFDHRDLFKRSARTKDPSFSEGTFKDHNNCFSRCVFARMELVDFLGFPQEALLRKALEDHVDNRKMRASKIRRLYRCFDDVKKVAIDDNCIYSTKIFKCMRLDEPGMWES